MGNRAVREKVRGEDERMTRGPHLIDTPSHHLQEVGLPNSLIFNFPDTSFQEQKPAIAFKKAAAQTNRP
jgi:hypothetical protein